MKGNILPEKIDDNEYLYRGITSLHWDPINKRISSGAYKNKDGLSVNRDYWRSKEECIDQLMHSSTFIMITRISVKNVRDNDMYPVYHPVEDNLYHSEIHRSIDTINLTDSQSRRLRDMAIIVFDNSE